MRKLVSLLALLFVCSVVLGSTSVSADDANDTKMSERAFVYDVGGDKGSNSTSNLAADSCSGYCEPYIITCMEDCYCQGTWSCCTAGCDDCCGS